jgi:hypothetical protein
MKVEFSIHALERMNARGILKEDVTTFLKNYDSLSVQDIETAVYTKLVVENNKTYLYRIFVNTTKKPVIVITVYKTSKIEKYGYKVQ